jgi:tRNA U34 5-methylaminomethyl-2-thiouridine-forming methyltransferase MnmC
MRPVTLVLVSLVLVGTLAACGGSGHKTASTQNTTTSTTSAKQQVEAAWLAFFSSKTPPAKKAALLENGTQFAPVLKSMSSSPLAKNTKAKVSNVKVAGTKAQVTYTIYVGSTPALKNQRGTAVEQNGQWKVSDASLCAILALQGSPPAACKHVGS